jgi:hypothetical protein
MPCSFSHPLAVVPLSRLCPARLNLAALVIGSMTPDFGYYFRQFALATYAHSLPGTFAVCLPTGLIALLLFYLLRLPLCSLLPQPHRGALLPSARTRPRWSITGAIKASLSLLIGAWTHTVWDSFTHDNAWAVQRIPWLRASLIEVGGTVLPTAYVLQQLSTLLGGLGLAFLYIRWLRRQPRPTASEPDSLPDRWRYLLLAALVVAALAISVPSALRLASHYQGYLAIRVFLFRSAVYSAAAFVPMLILSALALHSRLQARQGTTR